jgi:hypothetical protein
VLSEELRQRMQAAVKAERAQAASQERRGTTEPAGRVTVSAPVNGQAAGPPVNGIPGPRKHAAKPERATENGTDVKLQPARDVPPRHKPAAPGHGRAPAQDRADRPESPEETPRAEPHDRLFARIRLVVMAIAFIAAGSLITLVGLHIANSPSGNSGGGAALQRQEALTRGQAVSWVIQQVSRDDVVSCDRTTCAALRTAGFPPGKLLTLGRTSQPPVTSAVVVVTQVVRDLFGSSISSAWAPDVLASMGSGAAEVTIRVVAPHGALTYQDQLNSGLADREQNGKSLQGNPQIQLSQAAKRQLAGGQVDSRLLLALAYLASDEPIDIMQFGNVGPGASASLPLRYADLAVDVSAAKMASPAYQRAMHAFLSTADTSIRPVRSQTVLLPDGTDVFRVEFTAPSPLASISGQGSP